MHGGSAISSPEPTMMLRGFVGFWAMLGSACLFVGNGPALGTFTCSSVEVVEGLAREGGISATTVAKTMSAPSTDSVCLRALVICALLMPMARR